MQRPMPNPTSWLRQSICLERTIRHRLILVALAAVTLSGAAEVPSLIAAERQKPARTSTANAAEKRPNIVLIMADDLGYETVGCYGGHSYGTPNIDRLAAEGIRFDRAYAMPLCTNTRIQLMTGKYNIRNWTAFGILDPRERTFGHLLQQAGYSTCIAGKWQLTSYDPPDYPGAELRRNTGVHPRDAGFDEYSLWHVGHTEDKGPRYANPVIEQNGRPLSNTAGKYGPDIWVDFIGDFMRRHREQPFFVYYSMALPHNPMNPTPDSPEWQDPEKRDDDVTRYAADMIRYTDKVVGQVADQIDQLGLRENTLILFYSDNGTNWRVTSKFGNRTVRGGKGKGTELGIRVPMFANWKGVTPKRTVLQDLVDSTDFLPTLLDVAGATDLIADDIDGVSFAPRLKGQPGSPRDAIFIHQDPRPGWDKDRFKVMRLALNDRYKLREDGRLYDLQRDPFEESPILISADSVENRFARIDLQGVLDRHSDYKLFDPAEVPRPNLKDHFRNHAFNDQGGFVVIETELLPTPRDESWKFENNLPGYTGLGYLRSVRSQKTPPQKGVTEILTILDNAGPWRIAVRYRSDHHSLLTARSSEDRREHSFWLKVGTGEWMICEADQAAESGAWQWGTLLKSADGRKTLEAEFELGERGNRIFIAPRSANIKIDRIVVYQADQSDKALDLATPVAPYHPWASP